MSGKDPWFDEMSPDEFRDHYERKLTCLDRLSGECRREGCEETARFPRSFCSDRCMNEGLRARMENLNERLEELRTNDT